VLKRALFWRPEKSAVILLHDRAGALKVEATVEQISPSVADSVRRQNPKGPQVKLYELRSDASDCIESEVKLRPSPMEFEMAYQARVAIERIKFAIRHTEQFAKPCVHMREAGLQLLDALERLESLDRRFQARSRVAAHGNGNVADARE
jgi:hypothetical protein